MIPTYEPGPYLRETLESVLAQAPASSEMQIQVVDDCSVMDVAAMVAEIGRGRIVFTRNAERQGLMDNWNVCIQRSRGYLVHILHQDDVVFPGFYRQMAAGLLSSPSAAAGFCRHMYIDAKGLWRFMSALEAEEEGILPNCRRRFAEGVTLQCPAMVVRRETYERTGGFDVSFPYAADVEMWKRIARERGLFFTPHILAAWRMHSRSASERFRNNGQHIRDTFRVLEVARQYFPDERAALSLAKARTLLHIEHAVRQLARTGCARKAWRSIETMWRSDGESWQTRRTLVRLSIVVLLAPLWRSMSTGCKLGWVFLKSLCPRSPLRRTDGRELDV